MVVGSSLLGLSRESQVLHQDNTRDMLRKILPKELFIGTPEDVEKKCIFYLKDHLPILFWSSIDRSKSPSTLTITLLMRHSMNASSFFYDMIHRWLTPQKPLNIDMFFSTDFRFHGIEEKLTLAEICVSLQTPSDFDMVLSNKRGVEAEIRLGVLSEFHSKKILEFKGLSMDRKTTMIHEKIGAFVRHQSSDVSQSIFAHMQHFLVTCKDEFKAVRDYHHISRIISVLYLIRKMLKEKITKTPNQRHFIVKFLKTNLLSSEKTQGKPVLGILVGLNFLKEHEIFEKKHILKAIKNYLPSARMVENSFFIDQGNHMQTLYLEIEKDDDFSLEDLKILRKYLPSHLQGNIEQLTHPLFMPRNEEEIVRNMLLLSRQLKYFHDLPQVMISFDQETGLELSFLVIFLRVVKGNTLPIREVLQKSQSSLRVSLDRVKRIGLVRRKYVKEASVFRIYLSTSSYLRSDHAIDVNLARQDALLELNRLFGEVRDYNGGLIFKQNESYQNLKNSLGEDGERNEGLLEKFFYSIEPHEMGLILAPEVVHNLFYMLLHVMKRNPQRKEENILFKEDSKAIYIMIPLYDIQKKKKIFDNLESLNLSSSEYFSCFVPSQEVSYLGFGCLSLDGEKRKEFLKAVQKGLSI
ncbi:MAG: hypothetical protein WCP39_01300 [Chlamydiota bacterium]